MNNEKTEFFIRIAAQHLAWGASQDEVIDLLVGEGLSDEEAYLIFYAARVLAKCKPSDI